METMSSSNIEHICVECNHFKGCTYLQHMSKEHYTGCQYWEPKVPTTGSNIQYHTTKSNAQEVKHGKWIKTDFYGYFHTPIYECSICKKEVEDNYIENHKYCLHCGAKMDGKDAENE